MQFRERRFKFADELDTVQEIKNEAHMLRYINQCLNPYGRSISKEDVTYVAYLGVEPVTRWRDVHIVHVKEYGVFGYLEGTFAAPSSNG